MKQLQRKKKSKEKKGAGHKMKIKCIVEASNTVWTNAKIWTNA